MIGTPRPRVSTQFVRKLRKAVMREALATGVTIKDDLLYMVMKTLQAGDYNTAINLAKSHGFDLERMKYEAKSGPLGSNWSRMVNEIVVWGSKPRFLNPDKPLYVVPAPGQRTKVTKMEEDRLNYY